MSKSNTNGGGRGTWGNKSPSGRSIIGDVINHGKLKYWQPGQDYHYHCTLEAGENTLEAQLVRVLMRSITATGGTFDAAHFRKSYITFMTTPGSHNDAYASTCHRMFFANLEAGRPPELCPDNDEHNVDAIDGLVLPSVAALAAAARRQDASAAAAACAGVTRESKVLQKAASVWAAVLTAALGQSVDGPAAGILAPTLDAAAQSLGFRHRPNGRKSDSITACYLGDSLPSALDMLAKYAPGATASGGVWRALLANANTGGENVHRGAVLGAALGAVAGASQLGDSAVAGLHARASIAKEIDEFVAAIFK